MKNKKLIVLASVFLMATTAFAVSGCKPTTEGPTGPAYTVEFASETMTLMLGEKTTLTTTYDQTDGATLGFTSSNPSVVSVDEYGRIEALNVGTATITVTYGEASDTCVVEVTMGNLLPTLSLPNIAEDEIETYKSSEWVLTGEVIFNEKTYDDVALTYEVSDPTVGTVENGVFKPLKVGTTTVTVVGTWRGNTGAAMTKTITITVVPEVILLVNNGASQIDLSTETVEGTDYNAVSPFEIYATVDGEEMPVSVEVTKNAQLVTYDAVAKTVSSNGFMGESEITLTYEVEGVTQYLKVPVTIDLTIYEHETLVENFSAIHGDVATGDSLRSILGADILFAYDEEGNELTVEDNKVYGIETSKTGSFRSTITICSARRGYAVELDGYSGIFARAEDFAVFDINTSYSSSTKFIPIDSNKPMSVWDGYYVLMNNIDATDYTHNLNGAGLFSRGQANDFPCGLHGTFDGRGYTIKGMTLGAFGLFGYISSGATVKDVAFVDVNLKNEQRATTLAQWIYNATISNVYVHLAAGTYTEGKMSGFAGGIHSSVLKSCIVDTKDCVFENLASGVFSCTLHEYATTGDGKTLYTDVYVITDAEVLGWYDYEKDTIHEYRHFYAENKMPVETPAAQAEEGTTEGGTTEPTTPEIPNVNYKITGVFQYSSLAELTAAGKTFAAFNNCWDTTSGAPVWKSVNGAYPEVEQPSMGNKFNGESVGDFNPDWIQ
ncbi:MAG: Ig-like domain-containing protein [Clostridia bacterium]|nr:Ig-like domain-containing protein [Clostridia bacterium]